MIGQVLAVNPAAPVREPKHSVKKGKRPVLTTEETCALLDTIDTSTVVGLRDRTPGVALTALTSTPRAK